MLKKIKGGEVIQPRPDFLSVVRGFVGGLFGISVLLAVTYWTGVPAIMAPFGATASCYSHCLKLHWHSRGASLGDTSFRL